MKLRKIFIPLAILVAFVFIAVVATPYIVSIVPMKEPKSIETVKIEKTEIPDMGVLKQNYHGYKAIVVHNPELQIFLVPYSKGAFRLPYPTRDKPLLACMNFILSDEGISCENPPLPEKWKDEANWDLTGKSKGMWMPDLVSAKFHTEGGYVVFNVEYDSQLFEK